jgi:hypothetical protein
MTLMVQLLPATSIAPQFVVMGKSPEAVIPEIATGDVFAFVTVMTLGAGSPTKSALKVREVGEKKTVSIPVPDKGTTSGLPNEEFAPSMIPPHPQPSV